MATLSINQALSAAHSGGFTIGSTQVLIVAIAMAESGLRSDAYNGLDPHGGSWGILQINGAHFDSGATTKACALEPSCAFRYGFTLSNGGQDFTPWGAYTNGSYKQFEKQVAAVFNQINFGSSDPCWAGIKDGTPWQQVPACNPLNLQCFDPGQCARYAANLKVGDVGPAMSQTGPIQAGQEAGTFFNTINGLLADPTRIIKGLLGIVLILVGLALLIKQLTPGIAKVVGA